MGRTLEILKHRGASPFSLKVAPEPPNPHSPTILPLPESAEEVPFIEVGGPNHALQGSAGVLAQSDRRPKIKRQKEQSSSTRDPRSPDAVAAGAGLNDPDPQSSFLPSSPLDCR